MGHDHVGHMLRAANKYRIMTYVKTFSKHCLWSQRGSKISVERTEIWTECFICTVSVKDCERKTEMDLPWRYGWIWRFSQGSGSVKDTVLQNA